MLTYSRRIRFRISISSSTNGSSKIWYRNPFFCNSVLHVGQIPTPLLNLFSTQFSHLSRRFHSNNFLIYRQPTMNVHICWPLISSSDFDTLSYDIVDNWCPSVIKTTNIFNSILFFMNNHMTSRQKIIIRRNKYEGKWKGHITSRKISRKQTRQKIFFVFVFKEKKTNEGKRRHIIK